MIAFEAERGLGWLARGLELVPLLDRRSASCVLAMAGKYRRLLERIAAEPSLVLRGRLSLRPWEKGLVLARSLAGAGRMKAAVAVVGGGLAGLAAAIECADGGADVDALRGALAARRRDVLLRAKRPRARQRPARRAPLLHRVPRLPAPARRRAPAPAPAAAARPGPPRGHAARRSISRSGLPPPLHLASTLLRYAPLALRRAPRRRPRRDALSASSTRTTRRSTTRPSPTGCARTASRRTRSTRSGT